MKERRRPRLASSRAPSSWRRRIAQPAHLPGARRDRRPRQESSFLSSGKARWRDSQRRYTPELAGTMPVDRSEDARTPASPSPRRPAVLEPEMGYEIELLPPFELDVVVTARGHDEAV